MYDQADPFQSVFHIPCISYSAPWDPEFRYVEKDENDRISADQFKALEISPELKAQLDAYLQASK